MHRHHGGHGAQAEVEPAEGNPPHHPPIPPHEVIHRVLEYHTVSGSKKAADLTRGTLLDTELVLDSLKGGKQKLRICAWEDKEGEGHVLVNCMAPVRRADIEASNGVVHELGG
jgi:uncharacterized surface protein with fasciclin (FAS1) repeats